MTKFKLIGTYIDLDLPYLLYNIWQKDGYDEVILSIDSGGQKDRIVLSTFKEAVDLIDLKMRGKNVTKEY